MPLPVAKLKASDTPDVMRTEDGIDTIIRQAIGKDSLLYIPRANENPGQLIQLLSAFDQLGVTNVYSEYPGWPLLYPLKAPSDKCEKCSQEFCSTINYRRHLPVHHRFKKLDKPSILHDTVYTFQDTSKTRDLLGAYWDKLSVEEAKEVLSFENVMLEVKSCCSYMNKRADLQIQHGIRARGSDHVTSWFVTATDGGGYLPPLKKLSGKFRYFSSTSAPLFPSLLNKLLFVLDDRFSAICHALPPTHRKIF
ncbi:C2H2-like zinc finger protein [Trifolium pratense]|uniref:C2H2-like zinc finger protein n=1 Tax=Trifolium pratense TaxID=57577 RepID=A0A2K3MM62_TRIPR|nr:C2H2-like zinc finger protein [Trifolium pratense]